MADASVLDPAACLTTLIKPASHQVEVAEEKILHSANAGALVERVGQLRDEFRIEGRKFARDLAAYISTNYVDTASVFVYEEIFGTKDRLHWFIHLKALEDYENLLYQGVTDENWRDEVVYKKRIEQEKGGGTWNRMFVDGSRRDTVLLPQYWGMDADDQFDVAPIPAGAQLSQSPDRWLTSVNSGLTLHRTAVPRYGLEREAQAFTREIAQAWNAAFEGFATALCFTEGLAESDRIHLLIHMASLRSYHVVFGPRAIRDERVEEVLRRNWMPEGVPAGAWTELFREGSISDLALTPQCWGTFA